MPTRRRTLALAGGLLASLAGCVSGGDPTATDSPANAGGSPSPTPGPAGTPTVVGTEGPADETATEPEPTATPEGVTTVPDDLPAWEPDGWIETGFTNAVGLDLGADRVYATLSSDGDGRSAIAAIEPGAGGFAWTASMDGDAQSGSHVQPRGQIDEWGVTVVDGTVYSVHGNSRDYEWTAVHALAAASGDERWSFRRERALRVIGFVEDLVVVAGKEFFEPDHAHDTPEEPLRTVVYGLDRASGDERWSVAVDGLTDLAVGPEGVYAASGQALAAYGPDGGGRWERQTDAAVRDLAVVDGTVVAGVGPDVDASSLVGLTTGGERSWTVDISARWLLPDGDRVYAGDESVAAVTADGSVAWRADSLGHDPLLSADGDRLYTRTAPRMNAVDAYDLPGGDRQFRFRTPSNNGWPLAETDSTLVAEAITPETAEFTSLFAVDADSGEPRAVYRPDDTVFTALGHGGTVYAGFGDGRIGVFNDS